MIERVTAYPPESEKPLQERCGLVAIYNPTDSITRQLALTIKAGSGVQHRGQLGAGLLVNTNEGNKVLHGSGHLTEVFTPESLGRFQNIEKSNYTLLHCRYGTNGGYADTNLQPSTAVATDGTNIAVIHNGEFVATDKMKAKVKGTLPEDASDTYLFTQMLAQSEGNSWDEKILQTLSQVNGSFNLAIGVGDTLYLARDSFGLRPFVLGKLNHGSDGIIAASETIALDKIGATIEREIKRGEVLRIDKRGIKTLQKGEDSQGNFCDFEWDYFTRPDSLLPTYNAPDGNRNPNNWLSVAEFRERCGSILAKERPLPQASYVIGIPDSGVAIATGYANASGLPYRQMITRDHYDPNGKSRLFQGDQHREGIRGRVLGKLSIVPGKRNWEGKKVVLGDDSMVRGNVSEQITNAVFESGAKEVHWIIGFPPVIKPCHLGVSMRTEEELIAARLHSDEKKIAQEIGATSVNYISKKGFVRARVLSGDLNISTNPQEIFLENGGCGGCITGIYPISPDGVIYQPSKTQKT